MLLESPQAKELGKKAESEERESSVRWKHDGIDTETEGSNLLREAWTCQIFPSILGYVYCGRCGAQIGDKLGGIFLGADKMAGVNCKEHPCAICDPVIKALNKIDKEIFNRRKKHPDWSTERVLKGIKFE